MKIYYKSCVEYKNNLRHDSIQGYDLQILELIRYCNKNDNLIYYSTNNKLNKSLKKYKKKYNFKINCDNNNIDILISNDIIRLNQIEARYKILYSTILDKSFTHNNISFINNLGHFIGKLNEISRF